jgi:hypothetical protein
MTLTDSIDEELAWRLRLTADALDAAATIDALSTGFTLLGAAGIGIALWHPAAQIGAIVFACEVLLGLTAKWMAVRSGSTPSSEPRWTPCRSPASGRII